MNYIPLGYKSVYSDWITDLRLSSVLDTTHAHTLQNITADLEILATALYDVTDSRENNPNLFTESDIRQNIVVFRQTLNELNNYMESLELEIY